MAISSPLISVIIPTYNRAAEVSKAIRSVENQTHKRLEIIVVDDGSSDSTSEVLSAYQRREPRLQVIRQENKGVSVARNMALTVAKGDYIAFLDDDDRCLPRRLEVQLQKVQELEDVSTSIPILCTSDYAEVNRNSFAYRKVRCAGCNRLEVALCSGFPPPSTWFLSRRTVGMLAEVTSNSGGPQLFDSLITAGEDADVVMRARALGAELENVDQVLVLYSRPPDGKVYANRDLSTARSLEKHGRWCKENLPASIAEQIIEWYRTVLPSDLYESAWEKIGAPEQQTTTNATTCSINAGV